MFGTHASGVHLGTHASGVHLGTHASGVQQAGGLRTVYLIFKAITFFGASGCCRVFA
jgi:hypothetical protein